MARQTFDYNTCVGVRPGKKKGQFALQTYMKETNTKGETKWKAAEYHTQAYRTEEEAYEAGRAMADRLSCSFIPDCRHGRTCVFPIRGRTSGRDSQGCPLEVRS